MTMKLNPPITVTIDSRDGLAQHTYTACSYHAPDADHAAPWIESWSLDCECDDDEDEHDCCCRDDEEEDAGEALQAELDERVV